MCESFCASHAPSKTFAEHEHGRSEPIELRHFIKWETDVLSSAIAATPKMEARVIKDIPSLEKESFHDATEVHAPQSWPSIFDDRFGYRIASNVRDRSRADLGPA